MKQDKRKRPIKQREPYVQYVYHFRYPKNSIDVRKMTEEDMNWALNVYSYINYDEVHSDDLKYNLKIVHQMFEDHYPEFVI